MNKDDHLQQHLELCQRMYLRMLEDGTWPFPDSPNPVDMIGSDDPK